MTKTQKCTIECREKDLESLMKKYKAEGWKIVHVRRQPIHVAGRGKMVGFAVENVVNSFFDFEVGVA